MINWFLRLNKYINKHEIITILFYSNMSLPKQKYTKIKDNIKYI